MNSVARICLSIVMLIPAVLFAQDLSKLTFEKFTSKEGKFSVQLPGKPEAQTQKIATGSGDIPITVNKVTVGDELVFMVMFSDYPTTNKNVDPTALLDAARDGNKGKDGELIAETGLKFGPDKLPARQVVIKRPGGIYIKNLLILHGARLYQVVLISNKETVDSILAEKYYNSFELMK